MDGNYAKALDLLERAGAVLEERAPDVNWSRRASRPPAIQHLHGRGMGVSSKAK